MIKTFAEYQVEITQLFNSEAAYNAGVKEASDHFEEEKIKIHEYYDKHIKSLMGNDKVFQGSEENDGRLT